MPSGVPNYLRGLPPSWKMRSQSQKGRHPKLQVVVKKGNSNDHKFPKPLGRDGRGKFLKPPTTTKPTTKPPERPITQKSPQPYGGGHHPNTPTHRFHCSHCKNENRVFIKH